MFTTAEDVTPEWLTDLLHNQNIARNSEVTELRVILKKDLAYSTVARLAVQYSSDAKDINAPASLFLKLSRTDSASTHTPVINEKEVEFYKMLAPEMSCPPLIRCYDAAYSAESGRSHILLDDLSDTHSQPEQNTAPSELQSRQAIEALATAHAYWWNSPKLGNGIGTIFSEKTLRGFIDDLESSVARFIEQVGDDLTSDQKNAYELMLASAERIWGRLTDPVDLTVTHGDAHWWNFLYPDHPDRHSVHVFDWHLWHLDLGARDLAFLLALGGFAEPRPEIETEVLHAYHNKLMAGGVLNYSREQLRVDYRWSSIRNLNIPVIFWSQGKHETTWRTALRRAFDAYDRLRSYELIT